MGKVIMIDCKSYGNGRDGVHFEGDLDVTLVNLQSFDNGGVGVFMSKHAETLRHHGLPIEIDCEQLSALLLTLSRIDKSAQEAVVKHYGLKDVQGKVLDTSTFINNIISIANSPVVEGLINLFKS